MKKVYLLLFVSLFAMLVLETTAQTTYIPDNNFLQALIDLGYGEGVDGNYIQTANISDVTSLDVSDKNISDLTGIEDFVALAELICSNNNLVVLDLSANESLTNLNCVFNGLIVLDVRNGNNANITAFNAENNPGLRCIYVDDKTASYLADWVKDETAEFVNNEEECVTLTYIPDNNFEQALIDLGYDTGAIDTYVLTANINEIEYLDVSSKNINDLTGIEDFVALVELRCQKNNLTSLDVSAHLALSELFCYSNQLTSLNVPTTSVLSTLNCSVNNLTSLDLSANSGLAKLYCANNKLTNLDVRNGNNAGISYFYAPRNPDLYCIYVDDKDATYLANWGKDKTAHFVNNEAECDALSVNSVEEHGITLYPNPTSGIVKFDFSGHNVQRMKISDIMGKTLFIITSINQTEEIDLSNFANGLYTVTLHTDKGIISSKIIKK